MLPALLRPKQRIAYDILDFFRAGPQVTETRAHPVDRGLSGARAIMDYATFGMSGQGSYTGPVVVGA